MATDRAALRASLQRKTDQKLTSSTDQDTYLNLAELEVISDWMRFDKSLFRNATRQTGVTDANGILLANTGVTRLERLEDANKTKFPLIDDLDSRWDVTGYYFAGYDTTANKRQVVIMKNGGLNASATLFWYDVVITQMGAGTTVLSVIHEEFRDLIAIKSAQMYFADQGPPFQSTANVWEERYERVLSKARRWYRNIAEDMRLTESLDPDSGGGRITVTHIVQ